MEMHRYSRETERLAQSVLRIALDRLRMDAPLDGPSSPERAGRPGRADDHRRRPGRRRRRCGCWTTCWRRRRCRSTTPATWRSSPAAPTEAATLFDLVVGASSIYGGSWLEGVGRRLCREPGAALDRRPGRAARPAPAAASSRAARSATCRRWSRPATPTAPSAATSAPARLRVAVDRRGALLGDLRAAQVMDVERCSVSGGRARTA